MIVSLTEVYEDVIEDETNAGEYERAI